MAPPTIRNRWQVLGQKRTEVHRFRIDYKDVFDMQYVYYIAREWFIENDYATRIDNEFPEKSMIVRNNPEVGSEIWVMWRFEKTMPPKNNPMWRFDFHVDIHILGMKDVEIVVDGKKVQAQKGQLEFDCRANLLFDFENSWAKSPFFKGQSEFLYNKFYQKTFSKYKRLLTEEATKFQDAMKEYLKLDKYLPETEAEFWNQKPG
ncbi:hypothetical protein CMO91_02390 [Candidatus Woesearchaeota archaeon]|nr:hypothetical protein [Candidatus Woesearchaeota archaeon]